MGLLKFPSATVSAVFYVLQCDKVEIRAQVVGIWKAKASRALLAVACACEGAILLQRNNYMTMIVGWVGGKECEPRKRVRRILRAEESIKRVRRVFTSRRKSRRVRWIYSNRKKKWRG